MIVELYSKFCVNLYPKRDFHENHEWSVFHSGSHISPTTVANLPNRSCFTVSSVSLTYAAYQFPVQLQGLICGITLFWLYRCPAHVLILPPSISSITNCSPSGCFLPPVIVWDPYVSVISMSHQCVECNQPIQRTTWKVGQSQGLQPRVLHDIDSVVILVACQYRCTNDHTFLTTDPRVLELISTENIPFILLHRSGFMKSFCRKVIGLIEAMSISAVEPYIKEQRRLSAAVVASQVKNKLSLSEDYY